LGSRLAAVGVTALRFTHRGCGAGGPDPSDGAFEDTTLTGRIEDFRAALDALPSLGVTTNRVGAIGSSYGGMVVLAALDPRVAALALMATPIEIPTDAPPLQVGSDLIALESGALVKRAFLEDTARYDLPTAVREYRRPTLIVHGTEDEVVPVEHALRLYKAALEPKRLEIVEGADHSFSDPAHRKEALTLCVEWMRAHVG
jgi:fermentation-respiration switch protein FrsA (DUF1100 family)